ncbi:conserved hypothetical protein [Culex quinquefasciatus]|uniref:Chitin-binding type-2 domain-containing protein n=1 Tax=Culex quinquefasciatus TaxID=7176 RepID=B0X3J4_CULQU|nr:conserved hypothetical protein [Culex quinquefasciatus]|eukprot:XP_001864216.1 conserved hypothetical protein [Culex quinquefasciatus]
MLANLVAALLIAALTPSSPVQAETSGTLLNVSRSSTDLASSSSARAFPSECDGSAYYATCSSCSELMVCLGPFRDVRSCAESDPSKPFCVNGACTGEAVFNEDCPAPVMTCTGKGFFPDAYLCDLYHYCHAEGQQSDVYQCPPNYVFNVNTNQCKQRTKDADCVRVQCDPKKIFVSYGSSKSHYAFCSSDGVVMLKCPAGANFDGFLSCVFQCTKEGNYADDSDPSKFYQCYTNSAKKLTAIARECSGGKVFSEKEGFCVKPESA